MTEQCTLAEMIAKFDVQACGDHSFRASPLRGGRGIADASQILAQSIVAASKIGSGKMVKSIHMIFSRMASDEQDLELDVEVMHAGRSFASATVTASQGDKLCARGLVLMDSDEPDFISHQATMPDVRPPEESHPLAMPLSGRELRVVEQIDLMDPDDVGPAELNVWLKYAEASDQPALNCALIAHPSNHFSIATAMRAHKGVSQSMAHRSLSCGVLSLTVNFFEPATRADQWLLYAHESTSASRGLSHCRANIFTRDGQLIASFAQENMIRAMPLSSQEMKKANAALL